MECLSRIAQQTIFLIFRYDHLDQFGVTRTCLVSASLASLAARGLWAYFATSTLPLSKSSGNAIMALTCFGLRHTASGSHDADLDSAGRCSTCKQKLTNQSFSITQTHQAGGLPCGSSSNSEDQDLIRPGSSEASNCILVRPLSSSRRFRYLGQARQSEVAAIPALLLTIRRRGVSLLLTLGRYALGRQTQ